MQEGGIMTGGSYKQPWDKFYIKGIEKKQTKEGKDMWVVKTDTQDLLTKDQTEIDKLQENNTYRVEYSPSEWQGKVQYWIKLVGGIEPENKEIEKPNWDKIAEGKVRSLLIQALIQNRGLKELTDADKSLLNDHVAYCMNGKELDVDKLDKEIE